MEQKTFTAIVVNEIPGHGYQFIKYKVIPKRRLKNLCAYALKTFPGVHHINLYERETKKFYKQINRAMIETGFRE